MTLNNLKFVHKEINSLLNSEKIIVICLKNVDTEVVYPHPLTNFITQNNSNRLHSINSQRTVAGYICRFLNYIYENNTSVNNIFLRGFKDLTLDQGLNYLKELKHNKVSKTYYLSIKYYLNKFYYYLHENDLLNQILSNQLIDNNSLSMNKNIFDRSNLKTIRSINNNNKIQIKDFGKNRYELIKLFLNISQEVAPEITFGLCLQIFGGLRKGEVVNVMNNNISISNNEVSIKISDNRALLFPTKSNTKDESPKRVNYLEGNLLIQRILPIPLVYKIYEEHNDYLQKNAPKIKGSVFINSKGFPMTGQVYESRFLKVKKTFLERLLERRMYSDYHILNSGKWSTHIGRGLYSNILFDMDLNVTQIAILRGDRSIDSFQSYFDELSSQKAVRENLPKLLEYLQKL